MRDRENLKEIIDGLRCATGDPMPCAKCRYREYMYSVCKRKCAEDAIALLKAQEPRVMTLEEVRDEAEYMYLEKHSETGSDLYGCAIRGDWDGYGIELIMSEYDTARERWSEYGKRWRCWTSRPDEKRRVETPWN